MNMMNKNINMDKNYNGFIIDNNKPE